MNPLDKEYRKYYNLNEPIKGILFCVTCMILMFFGLMYLIEKL